VADDATANKAAIATATRWVRLYILILLGGITG
jgi:hypothetical protein